ncbi:uncharacterized protein N7459_003574 [Penicillium hispanicum]|uniref:uncharacterized protein n=1 Tax=Penicillium hispanicum TaxID=1080232 RepID=UPI00254156A4|nr:uncharacterized protein N7459_003574 [Penicillium hispanicum]KAJ5587809.1 hypothetical protein N7459_003574 [Penicillium hispanicum]
MGASTPQDTAPAYEELFEQRPSNLLTGYSRVAGADELDVEHDAHQYDAGAVALGQQSPAADAALHVHCDECDRQADRRERRRSKEHCCTMVSVTFMVIALFLMLFGIVAVVSARKGRH